QLSPRGKAMRTHRLPRLGSVPIVLAGLLAVLPMAADGQAPKRGGILKVAYGNEILGMDFYTTPGYALAWVAMNVGSRLRGITPDGRFLPEAAESWQSSPDGLSYTFKLKKNILFHDGSKVDAAAVKFTFDFVLDPANRSNMRQFLGAVQSVEVVDPLTVQIQLKHPYAFMMHVLAVYRMGMIIISPSVTQKYTPEERRAGKPEALVGCGPFKLVEWVKGTHLVMDRFDKYFEP